MIAESAKLKGQRILVVEDDYLVALVVVGLLEDAGAQVIGPAGRIEDALALIESEGQIDAAVLDVNLRAKKSYPVADALAARSIRFVFATGYDTSVIEEKYRVYPRCEKPFNPPTLIAALANSDNARV